MSFDTTWFRCPNCIHDLASIDRLVIGCENGHRFDISKYGTVTLLPPKAPRTIGDDREMLTARATLLDSNLYEPIADAVSESTLLWSPTSLDGARDQPRIADFGSGTGYYTSAVAQAHRGSPVLAADRSPVAARMSARAVIGATGVVLDIWRPLPLRDDIVDIALNIFAPRNPPEYARVISPAGILVVVVPRENHLIELQRDGAMLSIADDKDLHVVAALGQHDFASVSRTHVEYTAQVGPAQRDLLTAMGPTAHHRSSAGSHSSAENTRETAVTISVEVITFRRSSVEAAS